MGIDRLCDRSWCGHSIEHRPLGNGGLVFKLFFFPMAGEKVGCGVGGRGGGGGAGVEWLTWSVYPE